MIALLEGREARAREELDSWMEALREAEQRAAAARERMECARIAREEVLRALAEEAERGIADVPAVPEPGPDGAGVVAEPASAAELALPSGGHDPRPPQWRSEVGADVLAGAYRQVFDWVAAAPGAVAARELTAGLGRDSTRLNEVEKVRHRAYALEAAGWLVRERGGVFRAAAGPAAQVAARASAGADRPSSS